MAEDYLHYMRISIGVHARSVVEARKTVSRAQGDIIKAMVDADIPNSSFGLYDAEGKILARFTQGDSNLPPDTIVVSEL